MAGIYGEHPVQMSTGPLSKHNATHMSGRAKLAATLSSTTPTTTYERAPAVVGRVERWAQPSAGAVAAWDPVFGLDPRPGAATDEADVAIGREVIYALPSIFP